MKPHTQFKGIYFDKVSKIKLPPPLPVETVSAQSYHHYQVIIKLNGRNHPVREAFSGLISRHFVPCSRHLITYGLIHELWKCSGWTQECLGIKDIIQIPRSLLSGQLHYGRRMPNSCRSYM